MSDEVAAKYNFCGSGGKKLAFNKHRAWDLIVSVAVKAGSEYKKENCKVTVQNWLKEVPKRVQISEKRREICESPTED